MLLKYHLDQGISKAELSRRFGISWRNDPPLGPEASSYTAVPERLGTAALQPSPPAPFAKNLIQRHGGASAPLTKTSP